MPIPSIPNIATIGHAARIPPRSVGGGSISSGPPIPPLTPLDWWDPDLGAWQDLALTVPASANNDPIAALVGQNGGYGNLTNTGATDRPLLTTAGLNGHGYMTFDGSNDFMFRASNLTPPFTIVCAVFIFSWGTFRGPIGDTGFNIGLEGVSPSPNFQWRTNPVLVALNPQPGLSAWYIFSGRSGAGSFDTSRVNNNARNSSFSNGNNTAITQFQLAKSATAAFSNCRLGRIAIYNSKLSQSDEDTVVQQFMTYYGL